MRAIHISLLLHFIGIGMLFTTLLAGWILEGAYRKAPDWPSRAFILKLLRPLGLLSPASIFLLLLSGIGNMTLSYTPYTLFSDTWLTLKLAIFVVAAVSGVVFGIRSAQRARLVGSMTAGSPPAGTEASIKSMDAMQRLFLVVQAIFILIILTLSIVKPHW